jgi:hypothetical protein
MCWTDYAVIKLSSIFESLSSIGLSRKADIFLRLYINTGTLNVSVANPATATPGYSLTTANNTFNATCPFTINFFLILVFKVEYLLQLLILLLDYI